MGRIVSNRIKSEISLWFGKKVYLSFVNWEKKRKTGKNPMETNSCR